MDTVHTQTEPDEKLPQLNFAEKVLFGAWLFSILVLVSVPLIAGYFGTYLLFGAEVVRAGIAPWVTAIMVGILVVWFVLSHVVELILRRRFRSGKVIWREVLSTVIGLVILAALYRVVFTEFLPALIAAVLGSAVMLACAPLVGYLERNEPLREP